MNAIPIPVMVVEDEPRTRAALCHDVEAAGACHVVAQTDDAGAAVSLAQATEPRVVLMDLRLRHGTSIDAIARILRARPATRVLMVTVATPQEVAPAIAAGARGYIDKYASAAELLDAVRTVAAGGVWLPDPLPEHLATALRRAAAMGALTPQQLEVLRYVAYGYYNDQIARALRIEKRTVNRHLENIRERLGVHRRGDLGALGRTWGLEPPATGAELR